MNYFQIKKNQRRFSVADVQKAIDNGTAFENNGHLNDLAWSLIRSGACMFANVIHKDYTGTTIVARQMLPKEHYGTVNFCGKYWEKFICISKKHGYE